MVAYRAEATRGDDLLELRNMLLYRTLHHRVYRALPQGRIFRASLGSLLSLQPNTILVDQQATHGLLSKQIILEITLNVFRINQYTTVELEVIGG